MTAPVIPNWPNPPSRGDSPATFNDDADAWNAAFVPQTTAFNTSADFVNTKADEADADAQAAQASQLAAASSEAISQANANFVGNWSDQTGALNVPASVFHNEVYWILLVNLADVTLSEPSEANSDWDNIAQPPLVHTLTGGNALDPLFVNQVVDGSTYTLPAANSLPANSYLVIDQPSRYQDNEPLFQADGSDTIFGPDGSDTEVLFTGSGAKSIRITTDGISQWTV